MHSLRSRADEGVRRYMRGQECPSHTGLSAPRNPVPHNLRCTRVTSRLSRMAVARDFSLSYH